MKVISSNINGLNSALKYGFFDWLTWQSPDVVCLQEMNVAVLPATFADWARTRGYEIAFSPLLVGGNGGVSILSRYGFNEIAVAAGILQARGQSIVAMIGPLNISSVYVTLDNTAQERAAFQALFDEMREHRLALVCGDFNIIGTESDADTKYHSGSLGCKPAERAWLSGIRRSWVDMLPQCCTEERIRTFWVRSKTRFETNLGTRIDYQLASPALAEYVVPKSGAVFRDYYHGVRITDHGPITIEYDVDINLRVCSES